MATFVLDPWRRVDRGTGTSSCRADRSGHEWSRSTPCVDDDAGIGEYADVTLEAIGDRPDVVLVAQSMGGFTAPLVCERVTGAR